jgi:hypothetical protein
MLGERARPLALLHARDDLGVLLREPAAGVEPLWAERLL